MGAKEPAYDLSILPGPGQPLFHPPHIGHRNHLCDLAERGELSLEEFKALVRNANFICRNCGRVAAKKGNLCEPVPL